MKIRLNKFLSEAGVASRRKSEELIKEGRITINDKVITSLSTVVNPLEDKVKLDGELLRRERKEYFLLNKPKGVVTTTQDEKNRKNVVDLIKTNKNIFPVGRLDYNTTGVLLLTNDGDFANFLTHPSNKIEREYLAHLDKDLTENDQEILVKGIILDRRKSRFGKVQILNNASWVRVTTVEGRNHFVKRMFSTLGYNVKGLERTRFGAYSVGKLAPGKSRRLNEEEIKEVYKKKKA